MQEIDEVMASPDGSCFLPLYNMDDLNWFPKLKNDFNEILLKYGFSNEAADEIAGNACNMATARGRNIIDPHKLKPKTEEVPHGVWL